MIEVLLVVACVVYVAIQIVGLLIRTVFFVLFQLLCFPFKMCRHCWRYTRKCNPNSNPTRRTR